MAEIEYPEPVNNEPAPPPSPKKFTIGTAVIVFFALLALQMVVGFAVGLIYSIIYAIQNSGITEQAIETVMMQSPGFLFVLVLSAEASFFLGVIYLKKNYEAVNFAFSAPNIISLFLVLGFAMAYAIFGSEIENIMALLFGRQAALNEPIVILAKLPGPLGLPIALFTIAVLPAVFEELVFRGAMQNALENKYGAAKAVIVTSILFALIHLVLTAILPIFLLSLALGYIYIKTRNLLYPMFLHFVNNCLAVIAIRYNGFEITGINTAATTIEHVHPLLVLASVITMALFLFLLYRQRIKITSYAA